MLIKENIELKYEKINNLEIMIEKKKVVFLDSLSEKTLKKKMIKEMLRGEYFAKMFYLMPINMVFLLLCTLSKYFGYSEYVSITFFIFGISFCFLYLFPITRKCMLKCFNDNVKEDLKNQYFNKTPVDNDVLKLFIKKYGKDILAQMMMGKDKINYNDIYSYHYNDQKQEEYKKVHEVVECIENIK